jgi:hypothetical protein
VRRVVTIKWHDPTRKRVLLLRLVGVAHIPPLIEGADVT